MEPAATTREGGLDRRRFLTLCSSFGVTSAAFTGSLWARVQERGRVTKEMVAEAEGIAGLQFSDDQRDAMAGGLDRNLRGYEQLRELPITQAVPPAAHFHPVPPGRPHPPAVAAAPLPEPATLGLERPDDLEEVAFWPVTHLAELVRTRQVGAVELTEMYLSRLRYFDERLHCVVTLTEDLALQQAEQADAELAAGKYRGPLHGIPWGAKDLLHTKGIRTTYGAKPFEHQVVDEDATVVERLRAAGAVLVAKLSLGALAMGDVWFQERTRNPWNPEQGSSGSSAGPASATAAGLVGFSIGTETLGSIVSPCTRCGTTGLRPTYGRVSRAGAMALSWTMDKIGPICRSVEDCALVFHAIAGADLRDPTAVDAPFAWDPEKPLDRIRVGYVKAAFEGRRVGEADQAVLRAMEDLGVELVEVTLPDLPAGAMRVVLNVEAAAAFDEITRDGRVAQMVSQGRGSWPDTFRTSRLVPAVEYLQAMRARTLLMEAMAQALDGVDVFLCPSFGGDVLTITNLTGHPCVVLPNGFEAGRNGEVETPTSFSFLGNLYAEADVLRVAHAWQQATDFHLRHPSLEG